MQPKELADTCIRWDGSSAKFAAVVAAALRDSGGLTQKDLAREFEVADSTVSRWSNGVARPHPLIQKLIVKFIQRRAERMARAQDAIAVPSENAALGARRALPKVKVHSG